MTPGCAAVGLEYERRVVTAPQQRQTDNKPKSAPTLHEPSSDSAVHQLRAREDTDLGVHDDPWKHY